MSPDGLEAPVTGGDETGGVEPCRLDGVRDMILSLGRGRSPVRGVGALADDRVEVPGQRIKTPCRGPIVKGEASGCGTGHHHAHSGGKAKGTRSRDLPEDQNTTISAMRDPCRFIEGALEIGGGVNPMTRGVEFDVPTPDGGSTTSERSEILD